MNTKSMLIETKNIMHFKHILSVAAFLCTIQLQAQYRITFCPYFNEHTGKEAPSRLHISNLLGSQLAPKAKTTGIKERVKASVSVFASNQVNDTTKYTYSGSRGSQYDLNYMFYNDLYTVDMSPRSFPYLPGNIDVQSDTMVYWKNQGGNLVINKSTRTSYTPSDKINVYKEYNYTPAGIYNWTDQHYNVFTNGILAEVNTLSDYSSGILDSLDKTIMQYDAQGHLIKQTVYTFTNGQWLNILNANYTYDNNGNLMKLKTTIDMGSGWADQSELLHTYYPNNRLKTVEVWENDGSALAPAYKDSFSYTGNLPYFTQCLEFVTDPVSQQWIPKTKLEKHVNNQSLPDTVLYSSYDGQTWIATTKLVVTYTALGNPDFIHVYTDPNMTGTLSYFGKYHYYYEQYNATSVETLPAETIAKVFPNPATDEIIIQAQPGKEMIATLTDVAGRILAIKQGEGVLSFSLNSYPIGLYLVTVQTNEGKEIFRIIKQ